MNTIHVNRLSRVLLIAVITLLAVNIHPGEAERLSLQSLPAPAVDPTDMGTAFTYQGRLMDGANPANGSYDFIFDLYDDATAGTLIGTDTLNDHAVVNGLFMAELDFGVGAFTGFERWLEIGVRAGSLEGSDPYTTLSPRQPINPTPYATFARTIYRRTVVVKPVGTASQNGTELLNTLAGITGASSTNPYLLKIEPGIYDLGDNSLYVKSSVDIEGSGEGVTVIQSTGFASENEATVIGGGAELRMLTVRCNGSGVNDYATAILVSSNLLRLTQVSLEASGGLVGTASLRNRNSSVTLLDQVSLSAHSLNGYAYGIDNNSSTLEMHDSDIRIYESRGGIGIVTQGPAPAELTVIDSFIQVFPSISAPMAIGIETNMADKTTIRDSRIEVTGPGEGATSLYGIRSLDSVLGDVIDSSVIVNWAATSSFGIYAYHTNLMSVSNSHIEIKGEGSNFAFEAHDTPTLIRDSQVKASGFATQSIAISIHAGETAHTHEISRTTIEATTPYDESGQYYVGVIVNGNDRVDLIHDTIRVQPFYFDPVGSPQGGTGIYNEGGDVNFENSTINSIQEPALIGIVHRYSTMVPMNFLRVDNSEIYTCLEESASCPPIYTMRKYGSILSMAFATITSSLLSGGPVAEVFPITSCMWVTDENMIGFGWPDLDGPGPLTASNICP